MKHEIPLIECQWRPDFKGGLQFYCEFCKRLHLHGRGEGHRVAHCTNKKSPYKETGYTLKNPEGKNKEGKTMCVCSALPEWATLCSYCGSEILDPLSHFVWDSSTNWACGSTCLIEKMERVFRK